MFAAIGNFLMVLAFFFNPKEKERQARAKVWAIFNDLETKLAQALADKDMPLVDKIRHWSKEMRDKHEYLNGDEFGT